MATQSRPLVPVLSEGMSDQPSHNRFPTQVTDAINAAFDVSDGMKKRPGTIYFVDATREDMGNDDEFLLHPIDRDNSEQYVVVYGRKNNASEDMGIWVYDANTAAEASVTISADAQTYLNTLDAEASDIRMMTVADNTIIVNTLATPALENSPDYSVSQVHRDFDVMRSVVPDNGTYHAANNSTSLEPPGYWLYDVEHNGFAKYVTADVGSDWDDVTDRWTTELRNPMGMRVVVQRETTTITAATSSGDGGGPYVVTKTGEFAALTINAGDHVKVTGTGITTKWYRVTAKDDDSVTVDATDAEWADTSDATVDGIANGYECRVDMRVENPTDMHDVALALQKSFRDFGADTMCVSWSRTPDESDTTTGGQFTIWTPYRGSSVEVVDIQSPIEGGYYDLSKASASRPFEFDGTATAGTGTDTTEILPIADRWTRVAAPNQEQARFTRTTMPVKMVRTSTAPLEFEVSVIEYDDRYTGDKESNPAPQAIVDGYRIRDVAFHRNRMVFAAGESTIFSRSGDFFNFFIFDNENLADDDPVIAPLTGNSVNIIDRIMPFRKTLFLFTDTGKQFELSAPQEFTPSTVAVTLSTEYNFQSVQPVAIGEKVYFVGPDEGKITMYEYRYSDQVVSTVADDISSWTEDLLPNTIHRLASSTNTQTLIAAPTDTDTLYVFQTHYEQGQVRQRAWSKWVYESAHKIKDICRIGERLFLLVYSTDNHFNLDGQNHYVIEQQRFVAENDAIDGETDPSEYIPDSMMEDPDPTSYSFVFDNQYSYNDSATWDRLKNCVTGSWQLAQGMTNPPTEEAWTEASDVITSTSTNNLDIEVSKMAVFTFDGTPPDMSTVLSFTFNVNITHTFAVGSGFDGAVVDWGYLWIGFMMDGDPSYELDGAMISGQPTWDRFLMDFDTDGGTAYDTVAVAGLGYISGTFYADNSPGTRDYTITVTCTRPTTSSTTFQLTVSHDGFNSMGQASQQTIKNLVQEGQIDPANWKMAVLCEHNSLFTFGPNTDDVSNEIEVSFSDISFTTSS